MRFLAVLVAFSFVSQAAADIWLATEKGIWKVVDGVPVLQSQAGDTIAIDGQTKPPDPKPDEPDPEPTGLRGEVNTAAQAADDKANTIGLRDMYGVSLNLMDAGLPMLSTIDLLRRGEDAILDTQTEQQAWRKFSDITTRILTGSPVTKTQLQAIHGGLQDAATKQSTADVMLRLPEIGAKYKPLFYTVKK